MCWTASSLQANKKGTIKAILLAIEDLDCAFYLQVTNLPVKAAHSRIVSLATLRISECERLLALTV